MFARIMTILKRKDSLFTYVQMFMAEVLGTGMLMFFGCMGGLPQDSTTPMFLGRLCFGLTVMMVIQTFGHISGAHLNSCVTLAYLLLGYMKPVMAVVYVIAQFVGAILGFGLLKVLLDEVEDGFCTAKLKDNVSIWQGFILEIVITTVLILVCCSVWDPRNSHNTDSTALRFGLVISGISMIAGPYTGASMNMQRWIAPVVWGGTWENHWIFWLAPHLSAFIAVGLYKSFFRPPDQPNDEVNDPAQKARYFIDIKRCNNSEQKNID